VNDDPPLAAPTPSGIFVRAARHEDAAEITRLSTLLGYPDGVAELGKRLSLLLDRPADAVFVAQGETTLAGWIHVAEEVHVVSERRCDILGLVVDEHARGRGIGRALVRAGEAWARERGLTRVVVRSNVARTGSHPFYERLAYRRIKTQHVYDKGL
jgi:GNAT superfamily N-acetyltransferase